MVRSAARLETVMRGEVLAPGRPSRRVRVIDARDLAEWIIRMAEKRQSGIYNATGAEDGLTMEHLLKECRTVSGSDATFTWASEKFLLEQGVEAWSEMLLWLPEEYNGILLIMTRLWLLASPFAHWLIP